MKQKRMPSGILFFALVRFSYRFFSYLCSGIFLLRFRLCGTAGTNRQAIGCLLWCRILIVQAMKKLLYLLCFLPFCLQAQTTETTETTLSDTTGHKLLMSLTEQDSLQDSVPHRTSYQSFFGKNKTVWTLASWVQFNFCPSVSDSLDQLSGLLDDMESSSFVSAVKRQQKSCLLDDDTINYTILTNKIHEKLPYWLYVNSYYLKYASDTFTYNGHAYRSVIGEDTVNGRLYRLYNDSIEALWCDMSLTLGDTFRLPNIENYNGKGRRWIVDSVYYLDNRKIIRFELIKNNESPLKNTFL